MLFLFKMLGSVTGRLTERMVTTYFRSAEALLDRDRLPSDWNEGLTAMAKRGTVQHRLIYRVPWQEVAKPYLMKKVNGLHKYFEKCPFVDSPEARELLLQEFDVVIERWESSELSEILSYYDFAIDTR
jgi:hypothetical protein